MENVVINNSVIEKMIRAQDAAAAEFWAYPNADWQSKFQAGWLEDNGLPPSVVGEDGLAYGL